MLKYFPNEIESFGSIFLFAYVFVIGCIAGEALALIVFKKNKSNYKKRIIVLFVCSFSVYLLYNSYYWILSPAIVTVYALYELRDSVVLSKIEWKKALPYMIVISLSLGFTISEFRYDIINFHKHQVAGIIKNNSVVTVADRASLYVSVPFLAGIPFIGPEIYDGYAHIEKLTMNGNVCEKTYFVSYAAKATNLGPVLTVPTSDISNIYCY